MLEAIQATVKEEDGIIWFSREKLNNSKNFHLPFDWLSYTNWHREEQKGVPTGSWSAFSYHGMHRKYIQQILSVYHSVETYTKNNNEKETRRHEREAINVAKIFGEDVFNDTVMQGTSSKESL